MEKLRDFLEANPPQDGHEILIAAFEVDENGRPLGTITKSNGKMMSTIGMVEYLHQRLEDIREEIYVEIEKGTTKSKEVENPQSIADDLSQYFGSLPLHMVPDEIANLIREYDVKIRENLMKGNIEEFERLKMELLMKMQDFRKNRKPNNGENPDKFGDFKDNF